MPSDGSVEYEPSIHPYERRLIERGRAEERAALQPEIDRLREALVSVAIKRQEFMDVDEDHPNADWRMLARKMEAIARQALED